MKSFRIASNSDALIQTVGTSGIYIWTGGAADNLFSSPANWSPDAVPGANDTILFNGTSTKTAVVDSSFGGTVAKMEVDPAYTGTIELQQGLTVSQQLTQNGGTLDGPGTLTLPANAVFLWLGGAWSGSGTAAIQAGAQLEIQEAHPAEGPLVMGSWILDNFGVVAWSQGDVAATGAVVDNEVGALVDLKGDVSFRDSSYTSVVNNNGTVQKSGGTGTSEIDAAMEDNGFVNANAANMEFDGGGQMGGNVNAQQGASVTFRSGSYNLLGGFTFAGNGILFQGTVDGEPYILVMGTVVPVTNFTLRAGTLDGPGTLIATDSLNWNGGTMQGAGTTRIGTTARMTIAGRVRLTRRTIDNQGATDLLSGSRLRMNGAAFTNSGQMGLYGTASILRDLFGGQSSFQIRPTGRLTKYDAGESVIQPAFGNAGRVTVAGGTLSLEGTGNYTGTFSVASGATLTLTDGDTTSTHSFQRGSAILGEGNVIFFGSSAQTKMDIAANVYLRMFDFTVTGGGTITGGGAISAAWFVWGIGTIQSVTVYVGPGDWLQIGSEGRCILDNSWLTDQGSVDWVGARDLIMLRAAKISIDGSQSYGEFYIYNGQRIVDLTLDQDKYPNYIGPPPSIEVIWGGYLFKADGALTEINVAFSSSFGKIDLDGRKLSFNCPYTALNTEIHIGVNGELGVGSFTQSGGLTNVDGGKLTAGGMSLIGGTFYLSGGTLDVGTGNVSILFGGSFNGDGTITGNVVSQGGTFTATGTTTIIGNFTQDKYAQLTVVLGGTDAGSYGQLSVQGNVTLDGMVNVEQAVNGFLPAEGLDSFDIVTFTGRRTGTFAGINPTGAYANSTWTLDYSNPNKVTLRA